jgi:mono/diheme cytochrome c family protein
MNAILRSAGTATRHAARFASHQGAAARICLRFSALVLLLSLGCDLPGKPDPQSRPIPETQVVDFDPLFARHCAGCHGNDGKFGPAPPLNDPIFLAIVPDDELLNTISTGRKGTPMPAFAHSQGGPLTEEQVHVLAAGLKPRWEAQAPLTHQPPPYHAPAEDNRSADADRGRKVFARACGECHGKQGEGDHAGALRSQEFLQLIDDRALRRIIIPGRPDLGMPDYATRDGRDDAFEPLTSRDVSDLVALLAEWRRRGERSEAEPAQAKAADADTANKSSQE